MLPSNALYLFCHRGDEPLAGQVGKASFCTVNSVLFSIFDFKKGSGMNPVGTQGVSAQVTPLSHEILMHSWRGQHCGEHHICSSGKMSNPFKFPFIDCGFTAQSLAAAHNELPHPQSISSLWGSRQHSRAAPPLLPCPFQGSNSL